MGVIAQFPGDSMKVKPDLNDGYVRVVNSVFEGMAMHPLSAHELRVVSAIIRLTFGWQKSKDRIAASQLEKQTGLTRQRCSSVLSALISKRVVIREGGGQSPIKINTAIGEWTFPSKATRPPKNVNRKTVHFSEPDENGSLNRKTVHIPNRKTVHTKERKTVKNLKTKDSSRLDAGSESNPSPSVPEKSNLKPDAAIQSPNGKQWGYAVDLELAELMGATIRQRLGQDAPAKVNMIAWANEVRLLRLVDKRPAEAIRALFAWSQSSSFWKSNIQSPTKLRKHWSTLAEQRNEQRKGSGNGTHQQSTQQTELDRQLTDFEYARNHF